VAAAGDVDVELGLAAGGGDHGRRTVEGGAPCTAYEVTAYA